MTTSTSEASIEGNLLSPHNVLNPHPYFAKLRVLDPVHWEEGLQAWLLTDFHDVSGAFRDTRLRSDYVQEFLMMQLRGRGHDPIIAKDSLRIIGDMMVSKSGAEHTRLRRQAGPSFDPAAVESWNSMIVELVSSLLDRIKPPSMDLVRDLAAPMAAGVMTEVLGVPQADRETFMRWTTEAEPFVGIATGDLEEAAKVANNSYLQLERYILDLLIERRQNPRHDVISMLLAHENDGHMTPEELVANVIMLLNAGNVTTMDQLSNGMHALLSHPKQLALLRSDAKLLPFAVEEILRYCPALPAMPRMAGEDLVIRGKNIQKGQMLFMSSAAANRDPSVFARPDEFDITRTPGRILTFGFGGHMCLGAGLARRELQIAIKLLLERFPNLRLDEEHPPQPKNQSLMFRGYFTLPLWC